MKTFDYPALMTHQTDTSPPILLFAAPCSEINLWAGIPQKKKFGSESTDETVGFQREENPSRIASLKKFFSDDQNVIQNSILCAARSVDATVLQFIPSNAADEARCQVGVLRITPPDLQKMSFAQLLATVKNSLELRVPELATRQPRQSLIERLKRQAQDAGHAIETSDLEEVQADAVEDQEQTDATSALFEETHMADFWEEIAARYEVAKALSDEQIEQEFLGFSREALESYVYPVIVVDGQHRLRGAIEHAQHLLGIEPWKSRIEQEIAGGTHPDAVSEKYLHRASRCLPISLLFSADPAEQVFQFVVVNQKATPIGRALLGTIVSTTLSQNELEGVADRLKNAGIELEESRAISYLVRSKSSPFFNKVQRGIDSNAKDLLEWNVLGQLVAIFRNLSRGKLFGESNDYADVYRKKFLKSAPIVSKYSELGYEDEFKYWSANEGPWRDVFIEFWTAVKDKLADVTDVEARNSWGNPRQSNLFNKITLTILAADFFQYLCDRRPVIESKESVRPLVEDWLTDVRPTYFSRDWALAGVKKDSTGIKNQWAHLWKEYRRNPESLPPIARFRVARSA